MNKEKKKKTPRTNFLFTKVKFKTLFKENKF